jgi:hypothetical protein
MCKCNDLPLFIKYRREDGHYVYQMPQLPDAPKRWKCYINFRVCLNCGQIWKTNELNESKGQLAIKVPQGADWQIFDETPYQIAFLTKCRGGLIDRPCRWKGCNKLCLNGMEICPNHAFEMGLRE